MCTSFPLSYESGFLILVIYKAADFIRNMINFMLASHVINYHVLCYMLMMLIGYAYDDKNLTCPKLSVSLSDMTMLLLNLKHLSGLKHQQNPSSQGRNNCMVTLHS